ncbi:MAG: hypothetical protein ABFD49_11815 [Armatimonadota bacterium]|nr:hypothetical protein [bacterium]
MNKHDLSGFQITHEGKPRVREKKVQTDGFINNRSHMHPYSIIEKWEITEQQLHGYFRGTFAPKTRELERRVVEIRFVMSGSRALYWRVGQDKSKLNDIYAHNQERLEIVMEAIKNAEANN